MSLRISNTFLFFSCAATMSLVAMVVTAATWSQEGQVPPDRKQVQAQRLITSLQGPDLFRYYCASCHGVDGKGDGPVTPALNTKLQDLTTIAQRNGGMFPLQRIEKIISGDEEMQAHGSREMPVWGPIFHQVEEDRDFGYVRLHNVAKYIESIQQK